MSGLPINQLIANELLGKTSEQVRSKRGLLVHNPRNDQSEEMAVLTDYLMAHASLPPPLEARSQREVARPGGTDGDRHAWNR